MSLKKEFKRWRASFGTGLAIVLPVVISIAIVIWLFGSVANITNNLLFPLRYFLPEDFIYDAEGKVLWYWSLAALAVTVFIIWFIGSLARHYIGKKAIQLMEFTMLKVPLLNRIYSAIKQVNDAFTTNNRATFKQVVMVEFPREGIWSIGFITGENHPEIQSKTGERVISLFVPTTPNPTTGFLVLLPENKVTKLQMTVADGVKYIMSLGSVPPLFQPGMVPPPPPSDEDDELPPTVPPPPDKIQVNS